MSKLCKNPLLSLALGMAVGAAIVWHWPQQELSAGTAEGNDLFAMVTVPVEGPNTTEAVFILDHLNGILRGGYINDQTGVFGHQFVHNVAADFQVRPGIKDPKYAIVSGNGNLTSGANQPARGIIYIAEKNSGAVIAYGFPVPRGRGAAAPAAMVRLDAFSFREAIR